MAALDVKASACVVVSGLSSDRVNGQKLREYFRTADGNSGIHQLIMFHKIGTALIEFLTPECAANFLAKELHLMDGTLMQVRGLPSTFYQKTNRATLEGRILLQELYLFLLSLHEEGQRESASVQGAEGNVGDCDMDSDACVVVRGFPDDVSIHMLKNSFVGRCIQHLVMFVETGTAVMELFKPEWASSVLANERKISEQTGLQVRKLAPQFSLNEDAETLQRHLSQLQQQHETAKQNLRIKEQQLRDVTTENERLKFVNESLQAELGEAKQISIKESHRLKQENIERLKRQISSSTDLSTSYKMTYDRRGVAVIINNIRFEDMETRHGAEGDTDLLREAFEILGFTVLTFHDLDLTKMVGVMKDQAKADHSNHDCFVCCIMSHGTMGKVYSSDDLDVDIFTVLQLVNAKKCPSLKGKPKLFFIQACQGQRRQGMQNLRFDGGYDACIPAAGPFIGNESDFFLGLATVPGYVALRDPDDGAPYVKHLAKLLKDFGPTHDLYTIMSMVCGKMNTENENFAWTVPSFFSTLRKEVIFGAKQFAS